MPHYLLNPFLTHLSFPPHLLIGIIHNALLAAGFAIIFKEYFQVFYNIEKKKKKKFRQGRREL